MGQWHIRDLDSHNGTYVDKQRVVGETWTRSFRVLRAGRCLLIPVDHIQPFHNGVSWINGELVGPRQSLNWRLIEDLAKVSDSLLIASEPGVGEIAAARHFHDSGPRSDGPFTQIDCATLSERFESQLDGPPQQQAEGTLFLNRAELLNHDLQMHIWNFVGSRKHGAVVTVPDDLSGRTEHAEFLKGMLSVLNGPKISMLPVRERHEEIPWHIHNTLKMLPQGLRAHASLIEECIMRDWPGNTMDLVSAVKIAAFRAQHGSEKTVHARSLDERAGIGPVYIPGETGRAVCGVHHEMLHELLLSLFSEDEMRRFIAYGLGGPTVAAELPSSPCSPAHLAQAMVLAVHKHGIKTDFFVRLGTRFPARTQEIEPVASQWGVNLSRSHTDRSTEPPIRR